MKRLHVLSFCSHTAAWLVLVLLSSALFAEPGGGFANQLRDDLERQGWEMERAPDGSLIYWPPKAGTHVARQPAVVEAIPVDKPGEAREQPGPQTKPASAVREGAPGLAGEPGTAALTEAPAASPTEDMVESALDKGTPTQTSEAASRPPEREQRLRTPWWSGYYGHPMYRPLPPLHYRRPPPAGYRRAGRPCSYGPRDCRWRTDRRPGSPAPGGRVQSSAGDE